ncbi:MAG: class I SAM-dependent methyltransferase [Burkholderiales bacterium]
MTDSTPYVTVCPVGCAAPLAPTPLVLREGPLRRCAECGQLMSGIGEAAYWQSMQQFDQHGFNQPATRETARRFRVARRRLDTLSVLLDKPPAATRVLDVGCSRGNFLAAGSRLGFSMEGVEPAANIAAAARADGHVVHTGLLADVNFEAASFDAITLFEVIEHLQQPLPLLRECHRVLKPGGILVLSTGNTASWTVAAMRTRWDYFDIAKDGGHISFYNPRSIALLGARADFSVERIETARVKFHEKSEVGRWRYVAGKLAAEFLNLPARLAGRGHDMLAFLRRA